MPTSTPQMEIYGDMWRSKVSRTPGNLRDFWRFCGEGAILEPSKILKHPMEKESEHIPNYIQLDCVKVILLYFI